MQAIANRYIEEHEDQAPLIFCLDLMRGDPASFKRGYTKENAVLVAVDAFELSVFEKIALETEIDNHLEELRADA